MIAPGAAKNILGLVKRERIDCFVSNAGIYTNLGVKCPNRDCLDLIATNLTAPILVLKEVYAHYAGLKAGTIVAINSLAGLYPNFNEAVYCASKFGLRGFVKSLQLEGYKHNVRILDYYPGAVQTRMTRKRDGFAGFIKPEDIAVLILANVTSSSSCAPVSQELRKTPSGAP